MEEKGTSEQCARPDVYTWAKQVNLIPYIYTYDFLVNQGITAICTVRGDTRKESLSHCISSDRMNGHNAPIHRGIVILLINL